MSEVDYEPVRPTMVYSTNITQHNPINKNDHESAIGLRGNRTYGARALNNNLG